MATTNIESSNACEVEVFDEDRVFRRIAWKLMPTVFCCYMIAIFDRVNIGFAKLQMSEAIGLSATAYGLGAGIFFIGYCLFEIPSNLLLSRIGARIWISRIMVTWGVVTLLTAFVRTPFQFFLARLLLGVAEAGFFPGVVLYLSQWFPKERHGRVMSLFMLAGPISSIFVGPLSGWTLSALSGHGDFQGWQWLFIVGGVPALGMGVIFYLNACDTPDRAQWLPESDKTCVEAAIARSAVEAHQQVRLTAALFNWKVWTVGLVLASGYLALYGIIFWLPSILKNSGISSFKTIGLLSAVPWVLAAGATLLFGYTSDRFEKRRIHIFAGLLLGALGLAASVKIAHSFAESYAALSVGCACIVGTFAVTWSLVSQHLGKRDAAAGFALTNTLASVGSFVGPYLMGASQEHFGNLQMPTLLLAMVTAAGAVLILSVPESQQRRNHRQIVDV